MVPPPGGAMRISGSTPAGGQTTPLESASLSLRSSALWDLLPRLGGVPLIPGVQVVSGGGRMPSAGSAAAEPTQLMLAINPAARLCTFVLAIDTYTNAASLRLFHGRESGPQCRLFLLLSCNDGERTMNDDRDRNRAAEVENRETRQKTHANRKEKPSPPKPDDIIEGEGSPGLTITGGGGHA
jgi:hypothetical protein